MRCPYCGHHDVKVIDSRAAEQGRAIRRRRRCTSCEKRFSTLEHPELISRLSVIKKDGNRVPYDREKMRSGLEKACYKRPVSAETITRIVDEVEEDIFRTHEREIDAVEIGQRLADRLKQLDQVAYVRFASVYKEFRDLDDLLDEVRDVIESGKDLPPRDQGKLF